MAIEFKSLEYGKPVLVSFQPSLSTTYAEPQGYLFDTPNEQIVDGEKQLFEAYGYDPDLPGNTPTPFWGDHYIKTPTLWRGIKERVNREVFLPSVASRFVPAVVAQTRTQKIGKFICLAYHRHLVEAYEAVWALIDAMRRYYRRKRATSWPIGQADLPDILALAELESGAVRNTPLYRSQGFIQSMRRLEVSGLAPHYQPVRDRLQSVAAEMFEVITSEHVRSRAVGFTVRRSVWIPFLEAEIDMYAVRDLANETSVVIGSNKLRVTSTNPILMEEVKQLVARMIRTKEEQAPHLSGLAKSLSVTGAFFTNTQSLPSDVGRYAREHKVEVFCVHLPQLWLDHPERKQLNENDVELIGGYLHGPLGRWIARKDKRSSANAQNADSSQAKGAGGSSE